MPQPLHIQNTHIEVWHTANPRSTKQPAISVVVPVLQEEKIVRRTLEVFTPELCAEFEIELIVSDGGSTDSTIGIAQEYADVIVQHKENRRQTISEGRNQGALQARGKCLVFINGDTIPAEPKVFFTFVQDWVHSKGKYANYGAMASPVEVTPSERKWSDVIFHNFFNNYLKLISMMGFGVGRGECQIIRNAVFKQVGGYKNELAAGEDFDLFNRIAKHHRIAIANELLVYESPRRYRKFGYARILWSWFMNWLGALFLNKSISKEWEPVR